MKYFMSVVLLFIFASADAALLSRAGGQAYYDDQLDITWLADANFAQTSGFDADGRMTWYVASAWAAGLDVAGVTGWRLPNMDLDDSDTIVDCSLGAVSQAMCMDNEYGHLFYYGAGTTLGSGITAAAPGPFSNISGIINYWSGTEYAPAPTNVWLFNFGSGSQSLAAKVAIPLAWAVHSGDAFATVPIPAAAWLFGGALGLLGWLRRKA